MLVATASLRSWQNHFAFLGGKITKFWPNTQQNHIFSLCHLITRQSQSIGSNSIYHRRWNTAIFRHILPMIGSLANIIDNRCCILDVVPGSKCQQVISGIMVKLLIDRHLVMVKRKCENIVKNQGLLILFYRKYLTLQTKLYKIV